MGVLETYFHYRNSGIALVENASSSPDELRALGADASDAAELAHLHRTYFGPTRFSGKQRKARAAALQQHHSLATLNLIESYTTRVKKDLDAWNLRIKLASTPAHKIRDIAVKRLKELRAKRTPKPGVRFTYRATGPNSMTITDDASVIADIRGTLESVNKHNLLDAARTVIVTGSVGTKPAVHAQVVVTLDEFDRIINGDGDEIELQLTNGARMTGAEFLSYQFASIGYATIIHPVEGPINSYRTERSASWKQRLTLAAETQTCSRPGCNKPADYCHVHHIIPWHAGGYTNIKNLTFLCAYHNSINDDDPSRPTGRGYVFRIPGGISYIPPWGLPITATPEYQQAIARLNAEKASNKKAAEPPDTG